MVVGDYKAVTFDESYFGAILQYPNGDGSVEDYREFVKKANSVNCKVAVATDLMSLVLLTPPVSGCRIAFGSSQRLEFPCFMEVHLQPFLQLKMNTNVPYRGEL